MRKYVLTLDLVDDPALIAEYEDHHQAIWPEIHSSIKNAGVEDMVIYRYGNRLFMMMEVHDDFSFEKKKQMDAANPKVQEWETLMGKYQRALPGVEPGEKWALMECIFEL